MRLVRVVLVLSLLAGGLVWGSVANAAPVPGGGCKKLGRERVVLVGTLRCERAGRKLQWKLTVPVGVKVVDGLPFARTLPPGFVAREVAFQFAKDWTALMACLNWGPDNHNETNKNELGPVTSVCNKAVWGTPNAFIDWYVRGRLSNKAYYAPVSALWEKYTSYGVLIRHHRCPEGHFWIGLVCVGYPRGYPGFHPSYAFDHHIFYDFMRITFAGETWNVDSIGSLEHVSKVRSWVDPTSTTFVPAAAAQFAHTPVSAAYWEYPGCPLPATKHDAIHRKTCTVYWAYLDLSGTP